MFKRLKNSKIFTLQNTNTVGKTQNVTSVYYLVEIPLRAGDFQNKLFKKTFTKTPIPEFFYNKSTGPLSESLLKKKPRCRCIYVNFAKFLKAPFL